MKPVRLDEEAEQELAAAIDWYEQQRPGLGGRFLEAVSATVQQIAQRPRAGSSVPHVPEELGARRLFVHRFPYCVVFAELAEEVRVVAVAHGRRRPGYWRSRLRPDQTP